MKAGVALAIGAVLFLGLRRSASAPPRASPPPRQLPPPDNRSHDGLVPYVPTPPAVVARAVELLTVLPLGTDRWESDPTGRWFQILYRAETHGANAAIPHPHKGVSVYRPESQRQESPK